MKMFTDLYTERLLFNLMIQEDHVFVKELLNTEGWIRFIGDRKIHNEDDARNYIDKIINSPDIFYWVVRIIESNEPIGVITLIKRIYLDHCDLGFAFLPASQGKGFARESAQLIIDKTSSDPKYKTLLATTLPENITSKKLLKSLSFYFQKNIELENETLELYELKRDK